MQCRASEALNRKIGPYFLPEGANQSPVHEEALSEQGKAFLEARLTEYEKNPASGIKWKVLRDEINEKYGFNFGVNPRFSN